MVLAPKVAHPDCEEKGVEGSSISEQVEVETYDGKVFIEWDPDAAVTPLAQLPFFIQFLNLGGRFKPWVDDCPLTYTSPNALKKKDVLGSLFLSILSGHNRYAHMTALLSDGVNSKYTVALGLAELV